MFKKIFSSSINIFAQNIADFSLIILFTWVPANIIINLFQYYNPDNLEVIKFINNISQFLYPLVVGATTFLTHKIKTEEECSAINALKAGGKHYWKILKANIIAGLKIFLGFLALIIPGLYFATKYALINPIVICEEEKSILPRNQSQAMTSGIKWPIFWCGFIFFMIPMTISTSYYIFSENSSLSHVLTYNTIIDSFTDLLFLLPSIAMYLFYHEVKDKYDFEI